MRKWIILSAVIFIATITALSSFYVLPIYEDAIVVRFGRVVDTSTDPGFYLKTPFVDSVIRFDNRLQPWDGEPSDLLTVDKENIKVNTWARWRITDPRKFYEAVHTVAAGQGVLDGIIDSSVKNIISAQPLIEVLRNTQRRLRYRSGELEAAEAAKNVQVKVGREEVIDLILEEGREDTEEQYGLRLEGVAIKHFNYVSAVIPKIYERMRSERIRIANRYESEGREREASILGEMAKELERIESEGYRESKRIRGLADAEVIRIYAQAYGKDPEFFSFSRSLDIYPDVLGESTRLVLGTEDHDLFRHLKSFGGAELEEGN